jgi:hypothetical protein
MPQIFPIPTELQLEVLKNLLPCDLPRIRELNHHFKKLFAGNEKSLYTAALENLQARLRGPFPEKEQEEKVRAETSDTIDKVLKLPYTHPLRQSNVFRCLIVDHHLHPGKVPNALDRWGEFNKLIKAGDESVIKRIVDQLTADKERPDQEKRMPISGGRSDILGRAVKNTHSDMILSDIIQNFIVPQTLLPIEQEYVLRTIIVKANGNSKVLNLVVNDCLDSPIVPGEQARSSLVKAVIENGKNNDDVLLNLLKNKITPAVLGSASIESAIRELVHVASAPVLEEFLDKGHLEKVPLSTRPEVGLLARRNLRTRQSPAGAQRAALHQAAQAQPPSQGRGMGTP